MEKFEIILTILIKIIENLDFFFFNFENLTSFIVTVETAGADEPELKQIYEAVSNTLIGSTANVPFFKKALAVTVVLTITTSFALVSTPGVSFAGFFFVYTLMGLSIVPGASIGEALATPFPTSVLTCGYIIGSKFVLVWMDVGSELEPFFGKITDTTVAMIGSSCALGGMSAFHVFDHLWNAGSFMINAVDWIAQTIVNMILSPFNMSLPKEVIISSDLNDAISDVLVQSPINDIIKTTEIALKEDILKGGIGNIFENIKVVDRRYGEFALRKGSYYIYEQPFENAIMNNGVISLKDDPIVTNAAVLRNVIVSDGVTFVGHLDLFKVEFKEGMKDVFLKNLVFQDGQFILKNLIIENTIWTRNDPNLEKFIVEESLFKGLIKECTIVSGKTYSKDNVFVERIVFLKDVFLVDGVISVEDGELVFNENLFKTLILDEPFFEKGAIFIKDGNFDLLKVDYSQYWFFW